MESFLKELEKNYDLFLSTNKEIIEMFHFPEDIYTTFRNLLAKTNSSYFKNCTELKRDINKVSHVFLEKDKSGKCYLKVIGADERTIIIITTNDAKHEDYRSIVGTKTTEQEFVNMLDSVQRNKLEKAKISSRFLREEPLALDIRKEMNIPLLISYYRYINDILRPVNVFDEPENKTDSPPSPKQYPTVPRKHPVIDINLRKQELLKHNPVKIFSFEGRKTKTHLDAFVYQRGEHVLAVVEPESGTEYQYNLALGMIDINDDKLIGEMIKAAIESKEDIITLDDAIIRKNHTTLDSFNKNLDIFLGDYKTNNKFYYDVKKAKDVYHRK